MKLREISGVQKPVVGYAVRLGWLAWKMKIEGINGCPDYWFFKNGRVLIVEFKRPGKGPDPQQQRRHRELQKAGHTVHVIDNVEAGYALFD